LKLTVKQVEAQDIGHIRKMSKAFIEEEGREYPVFDDAELDKAMMRILINMNNPDYIYIIAYDGKKPAGFSIGYISQHPYGKPSRVAVAQEMYVVPSKRKSAMVGYKMIRFGAQLALERGAEGMECVGGYGTTDKMWQEFGFKPHLTYGWMPLDRVKKLAGVKEQANGE
jgi:hypothetical protein